MNNQEEARRNEEIEELKKLARKTRDVRMKQRYDTVRLSLQGRSLPEIAEILNINYYSVRNYVIAYNQSGIEGLTIKKPPGRKT